MQTLIAQDCLNLLPFRKEPISEWNENTDLAVFLGLLFGEEYRFFDATGKEISRQKSDYGTYVLEQERGHLTQFAEDLKTGSKQIYHERLKEEPREIDFVNDASLGGFAKAFAAWSGIDHQILSESGFVSIAHTLESKSDIECSMELAKQFYYRQAMICVRTFIEDLLYPLYFLKDPNSFRQWKAGAGRLPNVRGRDGILTTLLNNGTIPKPLSDRLDAIYGSLNAFVHGHSGSLIHKGTERGDWRGLSFKSTELYQWLSTATEAIECGIPIVKITTDLWISACSGKSPFCELCHSDQYEAKPDASAGYLQVYELTCRSCGHVWFSSTAG